MNLKSITPPTVEPINLSEAKLHLRVDSSDEDTYIESLIAAARGTAENHRSESILDQTWELNLDFFPGRDIVIPRHPLVSVASIKYFDTAGDTQTFAASKYVVDTSSRPGKIALAPDESWPSTEAGRINVVTVQFTTGYVSTYKVTSTATEVLTVTGRAYANIDIVRVSISGDNNGEFPKGLSARTDYHVVEKSGSTIKLSATSGGSAIDLKDKGVATHFIGHSNLGAGGVIPRNITQAMLLLISHFYEMREPVAVGAGIAVIEIPMTIEALLNQDRVYQFA